MKELSLWLLSVLRQVRNIAQYFSKLSTAPAIIARTIDSKQSRGETNLTVKHFKALFKLLNVDLDHHND